MPIQGIKVQIYPSPEQENYIARLLGTERFIHNKIVKFKRAGFKSTGKTPNWSECSKEFYRLRELPELVWLKDIHTKPISQALINVERAFSKFMEDKLHGKGEIGEPQFKSKHDKESCRFPSEAISGIYGNRLKLIKKLADIHFKCSKKDEIYLNRNQDKIKSATLEKTKSGKYFLSILIERPTTKVLPKTDKVIGIDIGIKDFVVTSDGERFENRKVIRSNEKKLKKLQRNHSKKQKGSKNKEKARIKLAKFHEKLKNQQDHYLHQISNKLLNDNQVVVFETLNIQGMMKNHHLAKSIGELSASKLIGMTEYKANWYGRDFVKIGQYFPSSKLCECCGFKNNELTLKDRTWICPSCGVEHDRDLNAAHNIRNEGLRLLAEQKLQPKVVKAPRKKIGGKKPIVKDLSDKTDILPACSGDVKLVEKESLDSSMKQEKNVITDVDLVVN